MDTDTLLRLQDLVANRQTKEAYDVVVTHLKSDPTDVAAWLWLSELASTVDGKRLALERALSLDSANPAANRALSLLPPSSSHSTIVHDAIQSFPDSAEKADIGLRDPPISYLALEQPVVSPPILDAVHRSIKCPSCQTTLDARDLFCKSCGLNLTDSALAVHLPLSKDRAEVEPQPHHLEAAAPKQGRDGDTKKCPHCAETLKAEAVVCRFCGRELAPPVRLVAEPQAKVQDATSARPTGLILVAWALVILSFFLSGSVGILIGIGILVAGLMLANSKNASARTNGVVLLILWGITFAIGFCRSSSWS